MRSFRVGYYWGLIALVIALIVDRADAAAMLDSTEAATVYVKTDRGAAIGVGTGVVFGDGLYVLTSYHVVDEGKISIVRPGGASIPGTIIWHLVSRDLAIVRLDQKVVVPPVTFLLREAVSKRQDVYALGFPGPEFTNDKSSMGVKSSKGIVSAIITGDDGAQLYQFDAPVNNGNSGGPLVDEEGRIIGVVAKKYRGEWRVQPAAEGIAYAVAIDEVIPALQSLGIPYFAEPSDEEKVTVVDGASSLWAEYKMAIIIALMVTVVAVGIMVVMRQRSAGAGEQGKQPYAGMRGQSSAEQPVLIGVGADRREVVYPLQRGHVTIGRDAQQCNVVLSDPAVSKRHCIVEYREMEGAFVVRDCQSTNGTFLMSGKRLQAGSSVQLRSGDSFYLVDPSRTYTVRKESRRVV